MRLQPNVDWHLLFGLLALQNGLISREQLVAAFTKWTGEKSVPLDELLIADGALDATAAETLRQLVNLHVQRHDGDPLKTLMTLSGSDLPSAKEELAALNDADLQQSIAAIPDVDSWATLESSVGEVTSTGGRFRILRPLPGARGGMGVISVAQDEELGRQVALKQILTDKADKATYRQKFQVEAEITGNLEHPGIVPIYGLGVGADGRPYYAMRLVHGDNLTAQIKQLHATLSKGDVDYRSVEFRGLVDRLIDVAQAVRYAHSRGVLHRDLKPGNILVGEYGETLVIDWGLARLPHTTVESAEPPTTGVSEPSLDSQAPLHIRSGSNVDATLQGQILGTVGYAPPEQLSGHVDSITERSDVYALGAILYQILVGQTPVSSEDSNLDEVIKDTIAGKITPPRRVRRAIPKSLSAVCMRALAREPADRYASVEEFIAEIERWKADQPVTAEPDSIPDRLMRLARRYRAAALATAAAVLGIAIVAGVALVFVNRARLNEADARNEAEILAKEKTKLAGEKTELADRNQAVVDSFVAAFRSADPEHEGVTSSMTALEVLKQAQAQIETDVELAKDELTKATLLQAIGNSLYALGEYKQAVVVFSETLRLRKAKLGDDHSDTLTSMNQLANGYMESGKLQEALPLFEEVAQLRKDQPGDKQRDLILSLGNLANGYYAAGRLEKALPLYEEALRLARASLGDEHPDTLISMGNLATGYEEGGRLAEALPLYEETFRLSKAQLGNEHPSTLNSMSNLAHGYENAGRLDESLPLFEETLRLTKAKLGDKHPDTLLRMNNLANAYVVDGRLDDAIPLFEETLRLTRARLGDEHPQTLICLNNLAYCYKEVGRQEESLRIFEEALRLRRAKLGDAHPDSIGSMGNLAWGYYRAKRLEDALELFEEAVRLARANLGNEHPRTQVSILNLGCGDEAAGRLEEAAALYEETVLLSSAQLGDDHPETLRRIKYLASALVQGRSFQAAEPVIEDWISHPAAQQQAASQARAETLRAICLLELGQAAEAIGAAKTALEFDEIRDVERFRAQSVLAAGLAAQQEATAEQQLVDAYRELRKQLADIPRHERWWVARACERVIAIYKSADQAEKVAEWKSELAELKAEIERLRSPTQAEE